MSTIVEKNVFKSRFGYHSCDYETYKKLKTLNKRYWQTLREFAEWNRWHQKEPQNQVVRKWIRDKQGRKIGSEIVGPRLEPRSGGVFVGMRYGMRFVQDWDIPEAYKQARTPVPEDRVKPLKLTASQINKFFEESEKYFG